ncbi:uncharacterized protein LOC144596724 [Rhinoraja longicauda]
MQSEGMGPWNVERRGEDVSEDGITLKMLETMEDDLLNAKHGGMEAEDKGHSILVLLERKASSSSLALSALETVAHTAECNEHVNKRTIITSHFREWIQNSDKVIYQEMKKVAW